MPDVATFLGRPASVLDFLIAFAAAVTAIAVLWKAPFIRKPTAWIARRLIGEPVTQWFRHLLSEEATRVVRTELKQPNGGSSIPDLVAHITELGNRMVAESIYTHKEIHRLNGFVRMIWRDWAIEHGYDPEQFPPPEPSPSEENDQ